MTLPVASLPESYENFVKSLTLLRQCPIPTKGVKFIALLCHIPACRAGRTVRGGRGAVESFAPSPHYIIDKLSNPIPTKSLLAPPLSNV